MLLGASAAGLTATVLRPDRQSGWREVETKEEGRGPRRRVLQMVGLRVGDRARVVLERTSVSGESATRLRVEEVGLFASEAGLAQDARGFLRQLPDRRVYYGVLARACLGLAWLGAIAAFWIPRARVWLVAAFTFLLTLAATSVQLWVVHNPYWNQARDLRVMLASGPLQDGIGGNLNYGMYLGSRLLGGEGLTFGPGWVPWERMPGYGFFAALAGLAAGFTTDLLAIGLTSIKLHLLLFAAANAAFVAAAARAMRPGVAVTVAALVCFYMPNQLANTQADSIMVPVYLLTAAALCLYLDRERGGVWPSFRYHVLVHLSFALWFLTRPEGVVGWAALSLILYRRALRYLVLPAALYLSIGLSWGAYKHRYTGEFSMTTNTVGDNAWVGLWQVPNKFRWQTVDASYFEWAATVGVPPTSKHASDVALREVVRFGATYPVYMTHLALYRFLKFVDVDVFNGVLRHPHVAYEALRGPTVWSLLAIVVLCLTLPHEARRTLFLGWPLLFNLPLFLFFFSDDMRHVAPCSAALSRLGRASAARGRVLPGALAPAPV